MYPLFMGHVRANNAKRRKHRVGREQRIIEFGRPQASAAELGSSREVVRRLLKDFEKRGWVELSRSQITVRDKEALSGIANT